MLTVNSLIKAHKLEPTEAILTTMLRGKWVEYPAPNAYCAMVDRLAIDTAHGLVILFFNTGVKHEFPIDEFFELITLRP